MQAILAAAVATTAAGILAATVAGAPTSTVQIAFSNAEAVWLIGADGSGPASGAQLTTLGKGGFPAWATDGTMLSVEGGDGNLYLVRADGSGRHRLTKGFGAAWAPGR